MTVKSHKHKTKNKKQRARNGGRSRTDPFICTICTNDNKRHSVLFCSKPERNSNIFVGTCRLLASTSGPGGMDPLVQSRPHTLRFEANPYEWTPNVVLFSTTVNLCRTTRGPQTAVCPHHVLKDSER